MDIQERISKMNLKVSAAEDFWRAKMSEFNAYLKVGSADQVENARVILLAAYEALNDIYIEQNRMLRSYMNNPPTRYEDG